LKREEKKKLKETKEAKLQKRKIEKWSKVAPSNNILEKELEEASLTKNQM
jgi:hypothetical protein